MVNEKMKKLGQQGSAIRELFEYGKIRKKEIGEDKVFDFSIGNPSVAAPSIVNETLIELLTTQDSVKMHGYTSARGSIDIRNCVANYLNTRFNANEDAAYVFLTCGAAGGLASCFHGLLNEGEEALVFAPFWPEYRVLVEKANGKLIEVKTTKDFLPDIEVLKDSINKKTKLLIINSPNNPTGVVYDENIILKIKEVLENKQKEYGHDIYLLSDEPYRDLIYSDKKFPFITKYYANSIVVFSFSKSLSLPGERIGYVLVGSNANSKDEVINAIVGAGRSLGYVCASSLFQYAIPKIIDKTVDLNIYKENRDVLYNMLTKIGYEVIYPEGAFYLFMKTLENDANNFSKMAKELFELLLVPSDSFGCKGYVRISYCVDKNVILNSKSAFEKLYKYYQEKDKK